MSPASLLDDEDAAVGKGGRFVLSVLVGFGALVVTALIILGIGLYVMSPTIEEVELPAPADVVPPVEPMLEAAPVPPAVPAAADPAVSPPTEPAPATPAPVTTPALATPAPATTPAPVTARSAAPEAPPPSTRPASSTSAPPTSDSKVAASKAAASKGAVSKGAVSKGAPPAEPVDDAPVRIAARVPEAAPAPVTPAPAPAPAPAPDPVAAPTPDPVTPAPTASFRVEFTAGDPSITGLEVKCVEGTGAGLSVVLDRVPKGNCRVTGRGGDAPLITMVTVVADRSYTCFGGRAPSCK
ncbi:MAG: hypothetical protein Q8P18_09215 [Pseudomonadota bacterium]|nr:hypothetical protein [Pseudomonadota bacterium]